MKKTLFAVAALALCGTAFAETYNTSDYNDGDYFNAVKAEAITLNVDKTVAFKAFNLDPSSNPLVLNFVGSNTFSVTQMGFTLKGNEVASITGDAAAAASWETALLATPGTAVPITLAGSSAMTTSIYLSNASFMGKSANQTLTLGSTELTYVGFQTVFGSTGMDDFKGSLGDNQIALVSVSTTPGQSGGGLFLVGKATATVPEPATATLSLMALAGLASRRRRK